MLWILEEVWSSKESTYFLSSKEITKQPTLLCNLVLLLTILLSWTTSIKGRQLRSLHNHRLWPAFSITCPFYKAEIQDEHYAVANELIEGIPSNWSISSRCKSIYREMSGLGKVCTPKCFCFCLIFIIVV